MNALKARAVADDPSIGAWHIESDDCPLEFTGDRPPCVVGITTNIQGPVPLNYCQHCNKDGNFEGPSGVQVECHAAQPTRDTRTGDMFGDSGEG
jgi:hypothetical protein